MKKIFNLNKFNRFNRINPLILKSLVIFLLALSIKLTYFSLLSPLSLSLPDSQVYELLAGSISDGQNYGANTPIAQGGFPSDLQRPPGYPLFIAILSALLQGRVNYLQIAVTQIILSSLLAVVLYLSISRVMNSKIGFLAAIFYALDWVTIIHTPLVIADSVYTFVITLCLLTWLFYLYYRQIIFALIGSSLLGSAALIKPVAQFIFIPLIIILFYRPVHRYAGIVLLVIYFAITIPWMVRNYTQHGIFTMSAISTVSLAFYTAESALESDNLTLTNMKSLDTRMIEKDNYWQSLTLQTFERKKMMEDEAWAVIRSHWPMVIKQSFQGFLRTCFGAGTATFTNALRQEPSHFQQVLWGKLIPLFQIVLYWILACWGVISVNKSKCIPRIILSLIVLAIVFSLLPSAMPLGYSRFRLPVSPLICILVAIGFTSITEIYTRNLNFSWNQK